MNYWGPLINVYAGNGLEDVELNAERAPRQFHPRRDPFELEDKEFERIYRLTKPMVDNVISIVEDYENRFRPTVLDASTKVLTALRFYAGGSYQMDVSKSVYHAVSQPSVSRSIRDVTDVLNKSDVMGEWIKFPQTIYEMSTIRRKFFDKYGFPGILGAIDCTHVAIFPPKLVDEFHLERDYVNRKHYHSINTQLICDSEKRIINVNARFPGAAHDSLIFENSNVLPFMQNLHNLSHTDYYLIGDLEYNLRPWIMTPIRNETNAAERRYNKTFRTSWSIIEQCNGVLKMRFRCLLKHRVLHYTPTVASKIINACTVLHNMCINANLQDPEPYPEEEGVELDFGMYVLDDNEIAAFAGALPQGNARVRNERALRIAEIKRRRIVLNYFS